MHKLTAGDGYTYRTRQVAVHDATDRGNQGLADYYAEKGESPGRWFGAGLGALDLEVDSQDTETHMRNLFGEGRHPDAERLENAALEAGKSVEQAKKASQLGRVFARYLGNQPEFIQETAKRYVAYNLAHGVHWKTPVPAEVRAKIRTGLGNEHFLREHGRVPIDDRERGSFMAKATRQQTTAVAGYDLTFAPVKSVSTLWALADRDVAKEIEAAHHSAVEATLSWLEKEVLFTRRGRRGLQQVKAEGLIAGMFTHRDARSSDPHLHTHVALSNKVYFTTLDDMVRKLRTAEAAGRFNRQLGVYLRPTVLVVDEVGYLKLDRAEANLVFQLVSRRYERGTIIITSNKSFTEWGGVLGDDVLATAILDRLLHHCDVLNINGPSYRLKDRFDLTTGGAPMP